jgi:hypothetical protein
MAAQGRLRGEYTYVLSSDPATIDRVATELRRRVAPDVTTSIDLGAGRTMLEVRRQVAAAEVIGLGPRSEEYKYLASLGFRTAPRLANYPGATSQDIERELAALAKDGRAGTVIFAGKEVLGYPNNLEATARGLTANRLTLGLIETPVQLSLVPQAGLSDLTKLVSYRAARVYAISRKELDKITPAEMQDRWVRSAKERNIRVMYLRPFLKTPGDLRKINLDHVRLTKEGLVQSDYRVGPAAGLAEIHVPRWVAALIVTGVAAGGWLLLLDIVALRARTGLALLLLAVLGALFADLVFPGARGGGLGIQAMALASALIFPTVGTAYPLKRWSRYRGNLPLTTTLGVATLSLLTATAISLAGAVFIGALLGDIRYLLEFEYFRGVKLVHIVPMFLLSLIYLAYHGAGATQPPRRRRPDVSGPPRDVIVEAAHFLRTQVRAKHVVILLLAAVAGYIYIGRTGNTSGLAVSSFELNLRSGLERLLVARPRTKEFLIGHPAMILAAWAALRGYRPLVYLLILAGSIGQVSAVNSFEHLRTPFALSLFRGMNGLVLGYAIGVVALFVIDPLAGWLRDRLGGGRGA